VVRAKTKNRVPPIYPMVFSERYFVRKDPPITAIPEIYDMA